MVEASRIIVEIFPATIGGCLPNVSVIESEGCFESVRHKQMLMEADDLFVRCNDAVFSASTIRGRLVKMLVTGNLTVETLLDTFRSKSRSRKIEGSLASLAGVFQEVKVKKEALVDPKLGVVPTVRIADEKVLKEKIGEVARLIGTEEFYLRVGKLLYTKGGMISDGRRK